MKVPTAKIRKAALKRARAAEGPSGAHQGTAPKRPIIRASPPPEHQVPPTVPEIDLTADTPPEGVLAGTAVRSTPIGAAPMGPEGETEERLRAESLPAESGPGPNEGPIEAPRAASVPPEASAGASSPTPVEPENPEDGEGGRAVPVPRGYSLMNDGRRAEKLMSEVVRPEFVEELRTTGATRFYREAYAALVRVTSSLATTRIVLNEWDDAISQARAESSEALARAEAAERALESAMARHADELKRALESAKADWAVELKRAEDRAEDEAARARAALCQFTMAAGTIEARDIRISELESGLSSALEEVRRATDEAERARRVGEESASRATAAEERVAEIEASVESKVAGAVEAFKASDDFSDELAEASADAYLQGFRDAKEKIARELNFPAALGVGLEQGSEGAPSGEESAADS